jgi:hypothetical protein
MIPVYIIQAVLYALALVFNGLFTWGRKCGASSASGEISVTNYEMRANIV